MKLNKYEYKEYNNYLKMNEEELDAAETELYDKCSYYNNCGICPFHNNKYENVNCKMDLISLVINDNVKIEVE